MSTTAPANPEAIFTYGAPQLKFGPRASDEIGFDLSQYQARRVLVVTDPGVADYPAHEPMVPHGMSVALTAPEAFRFTFGAAPQRHLRAAELLAPNAERPGDDSQFLPSVLISLMREISMPNGIAAVGYAPSDIPDLVDGTLKQQRLLATSPRAVTGDDVAAIFARSMELWYG